MTGCLVRPRWTDGGPAGTRGGPLRDPLSCARSITAAAFGGLPRPIETRSTRDRQRSWSPAIEPERFADRGDRGVPLRARRQCPDERQAAPSRFAASVGIIEQKLIGVKLLREGDGFPLSWIKPNAGSRTERSACTWSHEGGRAIQRRTTSGVSWCCSSSNTAGGIRMRSNSRGRSSA
jgi:hypothetical protein